MSLNKPNNEIDISTLANQDTLENVQSTVNAMNTTLGNYGGGINNIVSDIALLKQSVSELATQIEDIQSGSSGMLSIKQIYNPSKELTIAPNTTIKLYIPYQGFTVSFMAYKPHIYINGISAYSDSTNDWVTVKDTVIPYNVPFTFRNSTSGKYTIFNRDGECTTEYIYVLN